MPSSAGPAPGGDQRVLRRVWRPVTGTHRLADMLDGYANGDGAEQTLSARGLRCHIRHLPLTYVGAVQEAAKRALVTTSAVLGVLQSMQKSQGIASAWRQWHAPWRGSLTHSACCTRTPEDPQGNIILAVAENRLTRCAGSAVWTCTMSKATKLLSWLFNHNTQRRFTCEAPFRRQPATAVGTLRASSCISVAALPVLAVLFAAAGVSLQHCLSSQLAQGAPLAGSAQPKPGVSTRRTLSATPTRGARPGCARHSRATSSPPFSRHALVVWNTLAVATSVTGCTETGLRREWLLTLST